MDQPPSQCQGCEEIREQLQQWRAIRDFGSDLPANDNALDMLENQPYCADWMVCDECGSAVTLKPEHSEHVAQKLRSRTRKPEDHKELPPLDLEFFLQQLLVDSQDELFHRKLSLLRYHSARHERVIVWLLKNHGTGDLLAALGFAMSRTSDRWLTQGEQGRLAALAVGAQLVQECAFVWSMDLPPIPDHSQAPIDSRWAGRPLFLFDLDECNPDSWVSWRKRTFFAELTQKPLDTEHLTADTKAA